MSTWRSTSYRASWRRAGRSGSPIRGAPAPATSWRPRGRGSPSGRGRTATWRYTASVRGRAGGGGEGGASDSGSAGKGCRRLAGHAARADGAREDLVRAGVVAEPALDRERVARAGGPGAAAPHGAALLDEGDAPARAGAAVDLELGFDAAVAGLELERGGRAVPAGAGDADLRAVAAATTAAALRERGGGTDDGDREQRDRDE